MQHFPLVPEDRRADRGIRREAAMLSIVRACLVKARGAHDRFAKSEWPQDYVAELITRSAAVPTSLANATALATTAYFFVDSLTPVSAAAAVISQSLQLTFNGAAHLTIPSLTLPQAAWVSEGQPIPVVQGVSSAGVTLEPYKLATILPMTNELVRGSNAEAAMRRVLLENVAPTLDTALFSAAAAVPGGRPAGILNGVAGLTPTAGGGLTALVGDLKLIASALAPAAGGSEPVLIVAPAQAAALTQLPSMPWPVLTSAALSAGTIIGLIPGALATVIESPRIEARSDTVHMDTAPTDISTSGSAVAYPTRSLWQADSIGVRFIMPATWARRSSAAVAWISATTW
jgi:hypothetical protein